MTLARREEALVVTTQLGGSMLVRTHQMSCLVLTVAALLAISTLAIAPTTLVRNATSTCLSSDPRDGSVMMPCQSRVRLTPSFAAACGAIWANQPVLVNTSFQISFSFQVSNVSGFCPHHMNQYERCRARGGHGLALVVQNDQGMASLGSFLGTCQEGLGYTGIANSFAIELDMWHDPNLSDLFDNHLTLQTRGSLANSNDHTRTYAATADVTDLADGYPHQVRLSYEPNMDISIIQSETCSVRSACNKYQATPQFASMLTAQYASATTMGTIWVFLDDMVTPLFIAPMNLPLLLNLNQGRAYIGLTAATGDVQFQVHDVFNWTYCSTTCTQLLA